MCRAGGERHGRCEAGLGSLSVCGIVSVGDHLDFGQYVAEAKPIAQPCERGLVVEKAIDTVVVAAESLLVRCRRRGSSTRGVMNCDELLGQRPDGIKHSDAEWR